MKIEPCSDFLRNWRGEDVFMIRRNLSEGDFVPYCYMDSAGWFGYVIDRDSIDRAQQMMGADLDFDFISTILPGRPRASEGTFARYGRRDDNRIVAPFSKAMDLGAGSSVERSIFVQLSAQGEREIYLVQGTISCKEHGVSGAGAFNISIDDDVDVLIDSTNKTLTRMDLEGGQVIPYIAPLCGVRDGRFRLQIPSDAQYRACTLAEYKTASEPAEPSLYL